MKTKLLLSLLPGVFFAQKGEDTLKGKEKTIEEVVLTGFQKIEKSKVTSSVGVVKMKTIEQKATVSVDQMLQGKVAGVMINPSSGVPGQIAPIRIRGTASLSGAVSPLWVIDGMPMEGNQAPNFDVKQDINELKNYSIAGINPEDIESIIVLKDASATAVYGARAANGVILVTTKNGKKGKMRINFSSNVFVGLKPNFSKLNLMDSNEKVDFELMMAGRADLDGYRKNSGAVARILEANGDWENLRKGGFSTISALSQKQINELRKTNVRWGDLLYRMSVNQQYTLGFSGGVDKHNYYASFGYYDEKSSVVGVDYQRFNATIKNNYQLNDKIDIGLSVFGTLTKQKSFLYDSGSYTTPTYYSRTANPYLKPRDDKGNYLYDYDINYIERELSGDIRIPYNFIEERNNTSYLLGTNSLRGILDLNYKLIKGLEYRSQLGIVFETQKTQKMASQDTYFMRKRRENSFLYSSKNYVIPLGDYYNLINSDSFDYNWKNILEYRKKINVHDFDVLIGSEIRRTHYNAQNSQMYGYNPKTKTSVALVVPNGEEQSSIYLQNKNTEIENAYASFFGTFSYTYDNKYILFGSVRNDGTNLFGASTNKRWNPIWALSAAWNLKRENFLRDNDFISNLKFRFSYGLQGNYDKNTSAYLTGVYGTSKILNQTETSISTDSAPNPLLRWEKTTTKDVGVDLALWNNRVSLTIDLYHRRGTDILSIKDLPSETGFGQTNVNWAQLTNKGLELSLTTMNINHENFKWTTLFNISANRSNIDKVNEKRNSFLPSGENYPVNAVFGIRTAGLDENGIPQFYNKDNKIVSATDFYKISDPYGIGYIESEYLTKDNFRELYTYLGDRDPKYFGGITNIFNFKNWEFLVSASFNIKQMVLGQPLYNFTTVDRGLNTSKSIMNAWSSQNNDSTLPRIIGVDTLSDGGVVYRWFSSSDPQSYSHFDSWAKEISFVRINNIKLSYDLPSKLLNRTGIEGLKLALEGRNLFVFGTKHDGFFDPETFGNIYAQPIQKSVVFSIALSF